MRADVVRAEASPMCGISVVGRWRDPERRVKFPEDVEFVEGIGVFIARWGIMGGRMRFLLPYTRLR